MSGERAARERVDRAALPESGLAEFTGFRFARPALFAKTENAANPNTNERLAYPKTRARRIP